MRLNLTCFASFRLIVTFFSTWTNSKKQVIIMIITITSWIVEIGFQRKWMVWFLFISNLLDIWQSVLKWIRGHAFSSSTNTHAHHFYSYIYIYWFSSSWKSFNRIVSCWRLYRLDILKSEHKLTIPKWVESQSIYWQKREHTINYRGEKKRISICILCSNQIVWTFQTI